MVVQLVCLPASPPLLMFFFWVRILCARDQHETGGAGSLEKCIHELLRNIIIIIIGKKMREGGPGGNVCVHCGLMVNDMMTAENWWSRNKPACYFLLALRLLLSSSCALFLAKLNEACVMSNMTMEGSFFPYCCSSMVKLMPLPKILLPHGTLAVMNANSLSFIPQDSSNAHDNAADHIKQQESLLLWQVRSADLD